MSVDQPGPGEPADAAPPGAQPPPEVAPPIWQPQSSPVAPAAGDSGGWAWPTPPPLSPLPPPPGSWERASGPRRRSLLLPMAVIAVLFGIGGGAAGAYLVDQADDGSASTPPPAAPVVTSSGPVAGGAGASPVIAVADKVLPSVVSIDVQGSESEVTGSGFVYDQKGRIVTNNHVIEPAVDQGEIHVIFPDGTSRRASIVGRSPSYDLAVIQLDDRSGLVPATLGESDGIRVGQAVVAIGSPLGLNATVTSGIISAVDRPVTAGGVGETSYINALQTDAAINPGNSGGPLVDLDGFVIGVNSAIATLNGSAEGQSGSIGVGFSIPIDQVGRTVAEIIDTGRAEYPVIGASVSVTSGFGGAKVETVAASSPADKAGIEVGDLIKKVDDRVIDDGVQLIVTIRSFEPGDTVTLTLVHDGDTHDVEVVLGKETG